MTKRDPEVVDLLRDEPELLALADAVADTQRRVRRARGLAPKLAAVAAAAAGIAAVVLLWPGGGSGNGVLGRALAAIGDGQVLHLVMEGKTGEVLVNLESGERTVQTSRVELWTDRSFQHAHLVMHIDGQVADILLPDDVRNGVTIGTVDPVFSAFWSGYRKALEDGAATVESSGTIDGRAVYWLRFAPSRKGVPGSEVAIDQESYKPIVLRNYVTPTRYEDARIVVAETIPYDAADFTRVGLNLLTGVGSSSSSGSASTTQQDEHPVVKAPWLTPGNEISGLTLASVSSTRPTTGPHTIEGIELQYGTGATFGGDGFVIDEQARSGDPRPWNHIPAGWISIQKGQGSDENNKTFDTWTGQLVKDGIYVTIETGAGEDALLATARALQRAP
jgi:hypothetical protein